MSARTLLCGLLVVSATWLPAPAALRAQAASASDSVRLRTSQLVGLRVDTTGVPYAFPQFMDEVLANHPVSQQARLVAEQARAELRMAWGAFDPKLSASWDQKRSSGTEYYNYLNSELKIPLPVGADITVAYDRTMGRYFNPDRRTDGNGTISAGVSIPLGQRIITDERRTALVQARAARDGGDAERIALVNKLLFTAAKDYGNWYESWRRRAIAQEGEALAEFRLQAVRALSLIHISEPKPVLDGLGRGGIDSTQVASLVDLAVRRHPELLKVQAKVRQAEAERLLATQGLLPFAEAKLAGVAPRGETDGFFNRGRLDDNYKAALNLSTPLLYLKETGKFSATGAKLAFQEFERDWLRRGLEVDVRASIFDLANLERLLEAQEANVRNARLLRDAEQVRFENGESTLLILNLRERLVLDEAGKLAALEGKVASARGALAVATGDRTLLTIGR